VGRATSRQIATRALDREVETIIHTGNDQKRLRFEQLINSSTVLDLSTAMRYDRFFDQAAHALSPHVDLSGDALYQLLMERETESSTALRPDLAIPHIIIDGRNAFHILLARCREGIFFSELAPKVQAVFVLAGTRDQRDYHLYVLSAIAQAVQQTHFQEKWLRARNVSSLRVLAGAPRRN
jgi:mannitol/fructose-specific phosphotransferase system IIA component (Ntr-type)